LQSEGEGEPYCVYSGDCLGHSKCYKQGTRFENCCFIEARVEFEPLRRRRRCLMREQNETQERCLMSSETKRNSGEVFDEFRNKTDLAPGGGEATAAKWNGKSAASATSTCDAYNLVRDHQDRRRSSRYTEFKMYGKQ